MRKIVLVIVISIGLIAAMGLTAHAAKKSGRAATSSPTLTEQQRSAIAANAAIELNGREWSISLTCLGPKGGRAMEDVLTFTDSGVVVSRNLLAKGYSSSNYAINAVSEDGVAAWELVMSDADNNLAIWRGELIGNSIKGAMSMRPKSGMVESYSFSSVSSAAASPAAVPEPPAPAPSADSGKK